MHVLCKYLERVARQCRIPLVFVHGDFWIGNFLVNPKTLALVGIVDWDIANPLGLPLLDLLTMFVLSSQHYPDGINPYQRLFACDWDPVTRKILERYCSALQIGEDALFGIAISTWAFQLGTARRTYRAFPHSWIEYKLHAPLRLAAEQVSRLVAK